MAKLELQEDEGQFRLALESLAAGTALVALDGRWLRVNPALSKILGYTQEEFLCTDIQTMTHPDDLEKESKLVEKTLNGEIESFTSEKRYLCKDSTSIWALSSISLVRNYEGEPVHFVAQVHDISDLKQTDTEIKALNATLQQRVDRCSAELEAANEEYAAFSYSVSHDLRAPLRSIAGFSQAIAQDYSDSLDVEGKDFIRRVIEASRRMEQLIDDLLTLSRLARGELQRTDMNLTAIARSIATQIQATDATRDVSFAIAPGLVGSADPAHARLLLNHLLENAWKFTSTRAAARIEVGRDVIDGNPVLFVRDNGVGFDMAYADKLFKPFQRLHRHDEFDGTGIGLATAASVVRRHGGRIWADAALDRGATFYFTLSHDRKLEAA
jgi:PAS domain S-box-containing protein